MRMLVENFYNTHQFPGHTLTGSTSDVAGREPFRVATGRRSPLNSWTAISTGSASLRVTCDQVRSADMVAIERGSNFATCAIQFTNSTAAGWTTRATITPTTYTFPNARLDESPGAKTEDGAWLYRFASSANLPAATNWRLTFTASSGTVVDIVGAYLGKSWKPSREAVRPWDDDPRELAFSEVVSPELWSGAGQAAHRRVSAAPFRILLSSETEYDQARYHLKDLYWKRNFAWIVPDDEQAERSVLTYAPAGTRTIPYGGSWTHRTVDIDWIEHAPLPL